MARDAKALPEGKLEVDELLDPKELVAMLGLAVQVRDGRYVLNPHPARVVVPRTVWTSTARRPPKSKQVALPVCKHELLRPKVLKFIDVVRQ